MGKSTAQKDKYVTGLDKSRKNFTSKLKSLSARYQKVNEEYFEELEEILIEADVGVNLTMEIIEATKKETMSQNINASLLMCAILTVVKKRKRENKAQYNQFHNRFSSSFSKMYIKRFSHKSV